MLSNSVK